MNKKKNFETTSNAPGLYVPSKKYGKKLVLKTIYFNYFVKFYYKKFVFFSLNFLGLHKFMSYFVKMTFFLGTSLK